MKDRVSSGLKRERKGRDETHDQGDLSDLVRQVGGHFLRYRQEGALEQVFKTAKESAELTLTFVVRSARQGEASVTV